MSSTAAGLNSLRQALTPYEDVKFELNLNRHPKAHKDKSLIYALNMKLSKDGSVLENEESIEDNSYISNILTDYYPNGYKIIHIIPCNTELVLFIKSNNKNYFDIWRYREATKAFDKKLALFYDRNIPYNDGSFSGTFTYTSNDSLIIAFCEYGGSNDMNPMMTINLGTFTKGSYNPSSVVHLKYLWVSSNNEYNDRMLDPYKLPICPEVNLPIISSNYIGNGNCYTGTYYFYIRYKINEYDYTQWYNFGYPILLEHKNVNVISKKLTTNELDKDAFGNTLTNAVPTTYINNLELAVCEDRDLINSSIFINVDNIDNRYNTFDVGVICIAKTYTKHYIIKDLNTSTSIVNIELDNMIEENINTTTYNNYYNVKNIINRNNKLYISNYDTFNENVNINVDNVTLNLIKNYSIEEEHVGVKDTLTINSCSITKDNYIFKDYSQMCLVTDYEQASRFNDDTTKASKFINLVYYLNYIGCSSLLANSIKIKAKKESAYADGQTYLTTVEKTIDPREYYISIHRCPTNIPSYLFASGSKTSGYLYIIASKQSLEYIKNQGTSWWGNPGAYDFYGESIANYTWDNNFRGHTYTEFKFDDTILINDVDITSKLQDVASINPSVEDYNPYAQLIDGKINNNIITGLCKGEVYDFYIHFIDKYGNITNGKRLQNKTPQYRAMFHNPHDNVSSYHDVCFVPLMYNYRLIYFVVPKTLKVIYEGNLNIESWCFRKLQSGLSISNSDNITISNLVNSSPDELKVLCEELKNVSQYHKDNLTWGDIFDGLPYKICDKFLTFTNTDGANLFRVPTILQNPDEPIKKRSDTSFGISINTTEVNNILNTYGYVSYFITHRKLEKTYQLDGFGNKDHMSNILLNEKNNKIGNIIKMYHIDSTLWGDITIPMSLNADTINNCIYEAMANITNNVCYAENAQAYRDNRHSCVYFTNDKESNITPYSVYTSEKTHIPRRDIFYIKTLNINKSIYTSKDVKLYRLGNILNADYGIIKDGMNGVYKQHLALWYGNKDYGVVDITSNNGMTCYGETFLFKMYDFYDDSENSLYLSDIATSVIIRGEKTADSGKIKINEKELFYPVIKSLNMFGYKLGNIYDNWIDFYEQYRSDSAYLNTFNRTIYRSNVISDEGHINNWRYFESEAYKNIEENKGNITNLVSIGNYLYVHTEHSLFAFSDDNTLSMNNQNLQVATPDIFDTEYKEQFITSLGYGGLQDKHACVIGQFGYIWFDNDSKHIYKIYSNSLDIITTDIAEWFENCRISNVRFANDIKNNRILININIGKYQRNYNGSDVYVYKDVVLSYNLLSKTFISLHDYAFDKTFNTKTNLYFLEKINQEQIHNFVEDKYGHNISNKQSVDKKYKLSFIINKYYRDVKYLEYFTFKMRKRPNKSETHMFDITENYTPYADNSYFPVEGGLHPFAGNNIRVYNDIVDTDWIPCDTTLSGTSKPTNNIMDFNKPYWDLGNWNSSYLRDVRNSNGNPESRLFGNYFVISFDLGSQTYLVEFENLEVVMTEDKKPLM